MGPPGKCDTASCLGNVEPPWSTHGVQGRVHKQEAGNYTAASDTQGTFQAWAQVGRTFAVDVVLYQACTNGERRSEVSRRAQASTPTHFEGELG